MSKIRLKLDHLEVETFRTAPAAVTRKGTVQGNVASPVTAWITCSCPYPMTSDACTCNKLPVTNSGATCPLPC